MSTARKQKTDRQRIAALERDVKKLLIQVGIQSRQIIYTQEDVSRMRIDPMTMSYQ